jgi:hypothetical protein
VDLSKFDSGNFHLDKVSPGQVRVSLTVAAKGGDAAKIWDELRAELLTDPNLQGLELDEKTANVTLGRQGEKRTVTAGLRFAKPLKTPKAE